MIEPFAVVIHACRRVKLAVGHKVLICGAGPVGIMAMLCAKAFGASKVCITDIDAAKLDLAKKLGADQTFHVDTKNFNDQEFAKKLQKEFGYPPDTTIECTGVESSNAHHICNDTNKMYVMFRHFNGYLCDQNRWEDLSAWLRADKSERSDEYCHDSRN